MIQLTAKFKKGMGLNNVFAASLCILPVLLSSGCTRDSNDPGEELAAYCIRECVIETSDAEICDTRCKCAVENLERGTSEQEYRKIADGISKSDNPANEYVVKFRDAFGKCKSLE
ncbi:MAG TPA: hypothetical protein VLG45_11375 [Thermodesulfobacteriota bacterium]|nr:hypothetical protein [Thermodesulfobacteriota bacterium]